MGTDIGAKDKPRLLSLEFVWLILCLFLCICLIVIGAYTRISGSGLSISYWKPITSWMLPSGSEWIKEFNFYKNFPEYNYVNFDISLEEFKYIFKIEYLHRLIAKMLGIIYIFPGLYLALANRISRKSYVVISTCIMLQGFFGWLMVKSGLYDKPYVNHINLAIHLKMGILIYTMLFYSLRSVYKTSAAIAMLNDTSVRPSKDGHNNTNSLILKLIVSLFIAQIFLGGMMAGLHGGKIYQSFPFMGNKFVPEEIIEYGFDINDPVTVHFLHRICAYLLSIFIVIFSVRIFKKQKILALASICLIFLQIVLGFAILFYQESIVLPMMHSFMGMIIASFIVEYHYLD